MAKWIENFFLRPASAKPLAIIRIGLSLILLIQALSCASLFFEWYSTAGILQKNIGEQFSLWDIPQTTQFIRWGAQWGFNEHAVLVGLSTLYLVSLVSLLLGFFTRIAALTSWFLNMVFASGHFTSYGLDLFAHITLFYSIFMPMGDAYSIDAIAKKKCSPTWEARLSLRVLQIHLCIAYFATGVEKAMGAQWWSGEAVWRSLMLPAYKQFELSGLAQFPWLLMVLAWGTLIIEIGYPFFIFPQKTRPYWVAAILSLHVSIGIFLGMPLFAAVMGLLTFSCFAVSPEPKWERELAR